MGQTITASFGLDINPLKAGWNRAASLSTAAARGIGSRITSFITHPLVAIGGAVSGFLTYETFKSGIQGIIESGSELQKLHKQTGIAVGSLATLKGIFKQADVSADGLGGSVAKMQRNLFQAARAGGPAGSALRMLHLDVDALIKLRPEEEFVAIGKAIAALPSPLARASTAMTLFGKSGTELLPVFDELDNVDFGHLSEKAALLEKDSEKFHQITVGFRKARTQLQGVFLGMADALAPSLLALSKLLSQQNAIRFGVALGDGIRTATQYFLGAFANPGALADVVANGLLAGYATAGNFLINMLSRAAIHFTEDLLAGIDVVIRAAQAGFEMAGDKLANAIASAFGAGHNGKAPGGFADYFARQPLSGAGKLAASSMNAPRNGDTDFFGAKGFIANMAKAGEKLKAAGAPMMQVLDALGDSMKKAAPGPGLLGRLVTGTLAGASMAMSAGDFASRFSPGFGSQVVYANGTARETSMLANGGAFGHTPLLTASERRRFEDQAVASGNARGGTGPGAFGAIRAGDTARRKEFERQRLMQKEGQDKANELLEGIQSTLKEGLLDT